MTWPCRFKPITTNSQVTIGRDITVVASAEANITAYIKPIITFMLWESVPIVLYPKLGVTARLDVGSGSGCSNALSPHYQMYGALAGGVIIEPINIPILPSINKPAAGLGRPILPFGHEFGMIE